MIKTNSTLPKPIQDALAREATFSRALFERPESLSALLPYDEYLASEGVFLHKDGSLGAFLRVELLEHETMTAAEIITAVENIKSWFSLPENCVLQVLFEQSHISKLDPKFEKIESAYPGGHPISNTLLKARVGLIRDACAKNEALTPFTRNAYLSIRYFTEVANTRLARELLSRGEATLFREMKAFIGEKNRFRDLLKTLSSSSKIKVQQLGAPELLDCLRKFFNPKSYYRRKFAPYNASISLSDQAIYHSPILDFAGIEREGVRTRTITLKTSPQYAYPGGMAYFTRLNFPFRLSLNFSFPTKAKSKAFFDLKEFFLQNSPSARARRQREEVLEVQERLARDDRCLSLTFSVVVEGEDDEVLQTRVNEVVNVFHADLESEVIVEDDIGLGLCLNSLPLNYNPRSDYSTKRAIRILRSDATKFVPIFDSFRGLKMPLSLHLSRENNLVPFSLTENETSNHTVVLADSGSGKSAFIVDCVQAAKRMTPEPLVFVIDKKSSYTMLAEYFDGDLTVFDPTKEMPFSPFRGQYDEEKINFLTQLIVSCVRITTPHFQISSTHEAAVNKALKLAYKKKLQQAGLTLVDGELLKRPVETDVELTMDDVVAELGALPSDPQFRSSRDEIAEFLKLLMEFYGDGPYAQYFKGSAESREKSAQKLFYVYDLDLLDSNPVLQPLMTMAVTEEIRRIIKLPENQGRTGFIVFEELGMLGRNNPTAARFIVDFAETCRKLGYWLIGLTPRPQNYFEIEAGRAMWGVADNFIFLQMSADNVDYLLTKSSMIDEASAEIIKSLRTRRGEFADVFYLNKKKTNCGAFRYFQTPFDRWLAPTNAKDAREALMALKRFPDDKWEALQYLATTFPKGVEAASNDAT